MSCDSNKVCIPLDESRHLLRAVGLLMVSRGFPDEFGSIEEWNAHKLNVLAPATSKLANAINDLEWGRISSLKGGDK